MAIVTRKFRDDYEAWAVDRLARGIFTENDMIEFKEMLRRDLTSSPDLLREGLTVVIAMGVEIPATINDHEKRIRLWADYFACEAEAIPHPKRSNTAKVGDVSIWRQ